MLTFEPIGKKVLIVDDDPHFVRMISLAVSRALKQRGYDLITASNGRMAIESVTSGQPDLVVLDLNLPDMNGKELLSKVKEIDEDIAVIVVTGYGGERIAIELMKAGATDFISKPFEIEVLLEAIHDALALRGARIEAKKSGEMFSMGKYFPFLAHELRNPLHAIAGALAVIERRIELRDEILTRSVKIINDEVRHLTGFVQDCLDFVRHPSATYFVEGQINEIILTVMSIIVHMFEDLSKKIRITYRLDPALPMTHVNYEQMKQAFLNIAKNSFESMPEGGELVVETGMNSEFGNQTITVVFRDHGLGIRREDLKSLFNPFFTTKSRGSGLGLAICRRIIVDRHNGKIDIESEEGAGTKVTIELPIRSSGGKIS